MRFTMRSKLRMLSIGGCVYALLLLGISLGLLSGCYAETKRGAMTLVKTVQDGEDNSVTVEDESDDQTAGNAVDLGIKIGDTASADGMNVFKPTKDWQVIQPGQTIPKGLHVRMNLQTGLKEAKLMDGDDGVKYWKEGDREGIVSNKKSYSREELKEALKHFKANMDDVKDEKLKEEDLKKKFRSYDDLKKDLEELKLNVKTDNEILTGLYGRLKQPDITSIEKKSILTDLEYHLHKIDNAVDFSEMGGLQLVINSLNDTEEEIKSEAAFVIGSAVQSNPKVQVQALEGGVLQQLIRMLSLETSVPLRNRVLYAISAVVRHFPYAQRRFLELGGLDAMKGLFSVSGGEKLQLKVITLINDMLVEKKSNIDNLDEKNKHQKEKIEQYKKVLLLENMREQGWCSLVPSLLSSPDHDSREKVLRAMSALTETCKSSFRTVAPSLEKLKVEYEELSREERKEGDDDYFSGLSKAFNELLVEIREKDEL